MLGVLEQSGARFIRTSLQSLRSFTLPRGMAQEGSIIDLLPSLSPAAPPPHHQQRRGVLSVDVFANRVDKAYRTLKRQVIEEGFKDTWQAQSVYVKPSHERKLAAMQTEKKLKKRAFREKLRWIMRRNNRGF